MGRWLTYAGVGLLGFAAGYILCVGGARGGVSAPSDVLGSALQQVIVLGIAWALLRARRRTLGTVLAVTGCGLLAAHLGCGLALALGPAAIRFASGAT